MLMCVSGSVYAYKCIYMCVCEVCFGLASSEPALTMKLHLKIK